jgi:hemerythrin-like domain-containing protein
MQESLQIRRAREEEHEPESQVAALARGSRGDAAEALERFLDAWDAHTGLEDNFYFPALRSLRPAIAPQLHTFSAEHRRLRKTLRAIQARLAAGELEATGVRLVELVGEIAHHEKGEEKLVAELTAGGG